MAVPGHSAAVGRHPRDAQAHGARRPAVVIARSLLQLLQLLQRAPRRRLQFEYRDSAVTIYGQHTPSICAKKKCTPWISWPADDTSSCSNRSFVSISAQNSVFKLLSFAAKGPRSARPQRQLVSAAAALLRQNAMPHDALNVRRQTVVAQHLGNALDNRCFLPKQPFRKFLVDEIVAVRAGHA